jgi:hypothetical protein
VEWLAAIVFRKKYLHSVDEYNNGRLEGYIYIYPGHERRRQVVSEDDPYANQAVGLIITLTKAQ